MELADTLLKKITAEADLQKPMHILICFANPKTAKALVAIAGELIRINPEKSSIVALHLLHKQEAEQIENIETYKAQLFAEFIELGEKTKTTIRTFAKTSENFVDDILKTAEEQQSTLILAGIGHNVLNTLMWEKYNALKNNPENTEQEIQKQVGEKQARALQNISSLLTRNPKDTGILSENELRNIEHVFIPILHPDDIHIFTYMHLIAQKEHVKVMVWDALGLTETHPTVKKLFQYINRKTDGRLYIWDENKKIDLAFIRQQDLVIIGINGWEKLISSAITWTNELSHNTHYQRKLNHKQIHKWINRK